MIKLSDLLECVSPPDEQTDLMNLAIGTAKRLEALDVPRVETERKPLVDDEGDKIYIIVDERGCFADWQLTGRDADLDASARTLETGKPHTACKVMAPVNGECHTVPVVTFTPERPHEWIVYRDSRSGEGSCFGNGVVWFIDHKHHCVRRFATDTEAQTYIDSNKIEGAYPWPVPKLTS